MLGKNVKDCSNDNRSCTNDRQSTHYIEDFLSLVKLINHINNLHFIVFYQELKYLDQTVKTKVVSESVLYKRVDQRPHRQFCGV